ncbi:MAG TPA: putative glycoside hydrolase, partial [Spirochaetales bacterium]|nr:putative glycoside hydrolase [Spirochaetales bacterium]
MKSSTIRRIIIAALAGVTIVAIGSQAGTKGVAASSPTALRQLSLPAGALAASADGLRIAKSGGGFDTVLAGTDVRKIVRAGVHWYFLSDRGVLYSADLLSFSERNAGIPVKTIKTWEEGRKDFIKEIQEIKDLEVDPFDPLTLVACTKDEVYLSRDGAQSWKAIPSPATQPGLKAVAVTSKPEGLILASHPIKGPFVRSLSGGSWTPIGGDLGKSDPGTGPDELADIAVERVGESARIWAANSFLHRLYNYDRASKQFVLKYADSDEFFALDSLMPSADGLRYLSNGSVLNLASGVPLVDEEYTALVHAAAASSSRQLNALWLPASEDKPELAMSELWLVNFKSDKPHLAAADGRYGLYLQTHFMVNPSTKAQYDDIMTRRNLDMLVVDMKDDYGRLRFEPLDPLVKSIGRATNPLDIEAFAKEMKAKGRYLVAR